MRLSQRLIFNLPELYRSWLRVFFLSVVLNTVLFVLSGLLLSLDILDVKSLEPFKQFNRDDVLSYLAVIFAVLIPVFMRYIQLMMNAGYVYRKALPKIFAFREILFILVVSSFHVLISWREAYLYYPVLLMTIISLYVIFSALSLTFQFDLYKNKVANHIKRAAQKSIQLMINSRITSNKAYETLDSNPYVNIGGYHKHGEALKIYQVKAINKAYISLGREDEIKKLLSKKYPLETEKIVPIEREEVAYAHFDLEAFPNSTVKEGGVIGHLYLPKDEDAKDAANIVRKVNKIYALNPTVPTESPAVRYLDELLNDVEKGFDEAVKTSDVPMLQELLEHYKGITISLDNHIKSQEVKDYNLNSAVQELKRFSNDPLGSRVYRSFEILYEATEKAFKKGDYDLSKTFIEFIYSNVLNLSYGINISTIARYETLLAHMVGLFIYVNTWNTKLSETQQQIFDDILFRIKEHTGSLPYSYERIFNEEKVIFNDKEKEALKDWLKLRVDNLRGLSLNSIKSGHTKAYKEFVSCLTELDEDTQYSRRSKLDAPIVSYVKASLLMMYAYVSHSRRPDEVKAVLRDFIKEWGEQTITEVTLQCHDQGYADKWRIEMLDLPADGQMHSVPSYDLVLKSIWVDLMLTIGHFSDDPVHYGNNKIFEETTFFTDGVSSDNDNPLFKMIDEKEVDQQTKDRLKQVVTKLIQIRREWEYGTLASSELSSDKVNDFVDKVNASYLERSITQRIMTLKKVEVVKDPRAKGYKRVGINQIYDKEAFIEEWHIGYANDYSAEQLGENIAQTQDKNVLHELLSGYASNNDFQSIHKQLIKKDTSWVIYGNYVGSWDIEYKLSEFIKRNNSNGEISFKKVKTHERMGFGYLDDMPHGIYFVPSHQVGLLKIKAKDKSSPVETSIIPYSHNKKLLNELLDNPPAWLQEKGDKSAQTKYLKKKVQMLVSHVYLYVPPKEKTVIHFPLKDE